MAAHKNQYAVVGHPVSHSLSPTIHTQFARQCGQSSLRYFMLDLTPADFQSGCRAFFARGGAGLNITLPHKLAALELCDQVSGDARIAAAVNTISVASDGELFGDNTDGAGLVRDLNGNLGLQLRDARILLIGAGGAGRGVGKPLLDQHPACLVIANRTSSVALDMASTLAQFGPTRGCGLADIEPEPFDLIVNATSASLDGRRPAVADEVANGAVCYDMMYAPGGTPFTAWASRHGARSVHTGIGMLVEQAALSFEIWRGILPVTGPVLERLAREHGVEY